MCLCLCVYERKKEKWKEVGMGIAKGRKKSDNKNTQYTKNINVICEPTGVFKCLQSHECGNTNKMSFH